MAIFQPKTLMIFLTLKKYHYYVRVNMDYPRMTLDQMLLNSFYCHHINWDHTSKINQDYLRSTKFK